jgi:hypothetical protein
MPFVRTTEDKPSIRTLRQIIEDFFLLKEDRYFLLLEDGSRIVLTRQHTTPPMSINIKELFPFIRSRSDLVGLKVREASPSIRVR